MTPWLGSSTAFSPLATRAWVSAGNDFYSAAVAQGSSFVDYLLMLSETQLNAGQRPSATGGGQATLYFGPGQGVDFAARTTDTNGAIFDFAFNRHLVNLTA